MRVKPACFLVHFRARRMPADAFHAMTAQLRLCLVALPQGRRLRIRTPRRAVQSLGGASFIVWQIMVLRGTIRRRAANSSWEEAHPHADPVWWLRLRCDPLHLHRCPAPSLSTATVATCQRESGSAFVPVLAVPKAAFAVTRGTPRCFELIADSGHATTRAFCGDCGSSLFGLPGRAPEIVTIRAGSLDDPSTFRPSQDIYTVSAQPWDYMNPDLPKASKLRDVSDS